MFYSVVTNSLFICRVEKDVETSVYIREFAIIRILGLVNLKRALCSVFPIMCCFATGIYFRHGGQNMDFQTSSPYFPNRSAAIVLVSYTLHGFHILDYLVIRNAVPVIFPISEIATFHGTNSQQPSP